MTEPRPRLTDLVQGLPATIPFVGPEALERRRGRLFELRLGANESAFGLSPLAAEAIRRELARAAWYGDPEAFELRERLAGLHRVGLDEIVVGAGIDELLGVLVRAVTGPGDPVVTSAGAYPTFNYHVAGFGGRLVAVPYRDDHEDLEGLALAVRREGAKLVYLANPDNPMGTWHTGSAVQGFIAGLPADVLVLLDEAYVELAPADTAPPIDTADPRVVRLRTFSKAHGMAGLRIGYAIAHAEVIQAMGKIRNHFGVSRVAQAAAMASLDDAAFVAGVVAEVARGRDEYAGLAAGLGFRALPSATNFVAIDVDPEKGGPERGRALLEALADAGVFIRRPGIAPLDRCIRVSVGTAPERARFADIFSRIVRGL
ncbi:MAG TPA: aminotransferase class I/II-fold pyridoxal phosphate-dependent enzyme [Geminicoccaceae bacterium]|nr:aminotransferase class I/II-fold pyridoxal phosphate-dependent enzyme [Geminicoccaceae bacterium]